MYRNITLVFSFFAAEGTFRMSGKHNNNNNYLLFSINKNTCYIKVRTLWAQQGVTYY